MMKKALAVAMAALLLLLTLAGCNNSGTSSGSYLNVNNEPVDAAYVMTVDGEEISPEVFRFYYLPIRDSYESSGADLTDETVQSQLMEEATNTLLQYHCAIGKVADELGISLTEEETEAVKQSIETNKAQFESEEAYQAALDDIYATEASYLTYMLNYQLYQKIMNYLETDSGSEYYVADDALLEKVHENYVHVKHILVLCEEDDDEQERLTFAQELLERARNGEDFDSLITEYGEDPGMTTNPDGYYFTKDDSYVQEFKDASFALEENEISEPVKTDYGYHIIQRLPIDDDYVLENRSTFLGDELYEAYGKLIEDAVAGMEIVYADAYSLITPETLS